VQCLIQAAFFNRSTSLYLHDKNLLPFNSSAPLTAVYVSAVNLRPVNPHTDLFIF